MPEKERAIPLAASVKMRRYETDEGGLYQIELNNFRAVNFTRNYALGSERILSADPVQMSADEWTMFVDRGHGLYATSMITRTIATIGQYISEVERKYDLQPVKDPVTGKYFLSTSNMQILHERDPNAYQKYMLIVDAQERLRGLYDLEKKVDPNHPELQRDFKHGLQKVLHELREDLYQQQQLIIDRMHNSSDHILAHAQKLVSNFEWPNDGRGRRFAITEADQLLVKRGQHVMYDPSNEPSSATGGSVYSSTKGFGKEGRDNFAHCIALMDNFDRVQRTAFMQKVSELKPSEGLKLEATSQEERARETEALRIALFALKDVNIAAAFEKLILPYSTEVGREFCKKEFGCGYEEFRSRVFFHMMVHSSNDNEKILSKLIKNEFSRLENIESGISKKGNYPEKEKDLKLVDLKIQKLKIVLVDAKKIRDKQIKTLKVINKKLNSSLSRTESPYEQLQNHAKAIGQHLMQEKFRIFDDVKKEMSHILSMYGDDFCTQVFGASKSEFQEAVIRQAILFDFTGNYTRGMEAYSKKTTAFLDVVSEATSKRDKMLVAVMNGEKITDDIIPQPDRIISRKVNSLLEAKAIEIADSAVKALNPIQFVIEQAKNRASNQEKRIVAESLYRYALTCSSEQFNKIKDELRQHVTPYHDVASVIVIRELLEKAKPLKETFEKIYQEKYQAILEENLKKISPAFSFQDAVSASQAAALQDDAVKKAKKEFDAAMEAIRPRALKTDHDVGDVFLRTGVLGFLYKTVNPIFSLLEEMGLQDPIRGTLALSVMGATMGFTVMAHGATVATAAAQNAFMHAMATKTAGIIPAIYKNVMVLTPQASAMKTALAAMVDGVTVGKALYLLTSSADMAASNSLSGFTGNIIAGIMNNPIETAILVGVMTALGHGMILGLHEQADMGPAGWDMMGGFFEALKVADVGYHAIREIAMIVADGLARSPEGLQDIPKVKLFFAEMFAQAIRNKLEGHEDDNVLKTQLAELFETALKDIDITNPAEMSVVTGKFLLLLDASDISNKIRDKIEIIALQATPDYSQLYQLFQKDEIKNGEIVSPLQFLEKKYEHEAKAFSAGATVSDPIHRQHKKEYLAGLFVQDLLTEKSKDSAAWKAVFANQALQNQVTAISGVPWAVLRDQPVPKYRSTSEKVADVLAAAAPSLAATAEGAGKLSVMTGRVVGHIATIAATAVLRAGTGTLQFFADAGILSGAAMVNQAGESVANVVSSTVAKHTIARPDNVSAWRREFTGAALTEKGSFVPVGISQQNFYFDLYGMVYEAGDSFISQLSKIAKETIDKNKSIANSEKSITQEQVLNLLKSMFPKEVADLDNQLNQKGISDITERKSYMFSSLQKLCRDEIKMCSDAEIAVLKKQSVLVEVLVGQKMDFDNIRNPVKSVSEEIVRKMEATRAAVHDVSVVMRNEAVERKVATAPYRMSQAPVEIAFDAKVSKKNGKGEDIIAALKTVCKVYHETKSAFGLDSNLIKRLSAVLSDLPKEMATKSSHEVALHVLSKLFPVEAMKINAALLRNPEVNRDAVMLETLQKVFNAEITAAATKSKTAHYAFTQTLNKDDSLRMLLTGSSEKLNEVTVEKAHVTNYQISSIFSSSDKKKDDNQQSLASPPKP